MHFGQVLVLNRHQEVVEWLCIVNGSTHMLSKPWSTAPALGFLGTEHRPYDCRDLSGPDCLSYPVQPRQAVLQKPLLGIQLHTGAQGLQGLRQS